MISIKSKLYPRVFFSILFFAMALLAFYITRPFLVALATGAIIAYLVYPVYGKVLQIVRKKNIASLLIVIFLILTITIPFAIVIGSVSREAYYTYTTLSQHNIGANFMKIVCQDENSFACRSARSALKLLPKDDPDFYIQRAIEKITEFIYLNVSKIVASIPSFMLNFFVMLFVIYYLLKDGEKVVKRIKNLLPFKDPHKKHVFERFHHLTYAMFYGNISVALIQGVAGTIGFFIFGVPSPLLWGFVMALFALIPYVGTAIIWLPAAMNLIFMGYLQNSNSLIIKGVLLIAYGAIIISSIDNILKPKLISRNANVHPILVLLGILGGLSLFGFAGLILGPMMLALLMTFVDIYEEEKDHIEDYF